MEAAKRILSKMVGEEISMEEMDLLSGAGDHVDDRSCGDYLTGYAEYGEPLCDDA